jgi:hypothetical protein
MAKLGEALRTTDTTQLKVYLRDLRFSETLIEDIIADKNVRASWMEKSHLTPIEIASIMEKLHETEDWPLEGKRALQHLEDTLNQTIIKPHNDHNLYIPILAAQWPGRA